MFGENVNSNVWWKRKQQGLVQMETQGLVQMEKAIFGANEMYTARFAGNGNSKIWRKCN